MDSTRTLDEARLLVVEPPEPRAGVLSAPLGDDALEVVAVPTATAALERLETDHIDCLLTAQSLSDAETSGLDLLEAVRARPRSSGRARAGRGRRRTGQRGDCDGVTAYVPRDRTGDGSSDDCQAAIERALRRARETAATRARTPVRRDLRGGGNALVGARTGRNRPTGQRTRTRGNRRDRERRPRPAVRGASLVAVYRRRKNSAPGSDRPSAERRDRTPRADADPHRWHGYS